MNSNNNIIDNISKEAKIAKLCKEKGWNIDELSTGQMLFIMNHPEVKSKKKK